MRRNAHIIISMLACVVAVSVAFQSHAQTEGELRNKIDSKNKEIADLEKEIAEYQQQIVAVGKETDTLKSAIATLDISRKKLLADLSLTQKKIDSVTLTIESLRGQILDKQGSIEVQHQALAESVRRISNTDQISLLEAVLLYEDLGDLWNMAVEAEEVHGAMRMRVLELNQIKNDLNNTKDETEEKRSELQALKNQLNDQKRIVEDNKAETNKLFQQTKNKESEYKRLLSDRQAKYEATQQEISNFEAQLKLLIDPNSFPQAGSGVLAWPVTNPYVTQKFGLTSDSKRLYASGTHNGIDFRASPGTPIMAALSGVVWATGNTDTVCPGASYGKWVLVKHANGLSTLYAHLSLIKVSQGQNVSTRDLVGYSGSTGYATGPHLHFTLYATQGVQVTELKSKVCKGTYTLPVADPSAYLDPMAYL